MNTEEREIEPARGGNHTFLFTLRLWRASAAPGKAEWRGRLQFIATGQVHYFRDWEALVIHLREMLPETGGTSEEEE